MLLNQLTVIILGIMGLEKSGGPARKPVSRVVESVVEGNRIRSDLIDIYRNRLKDVTLSALAPNELLASFNDVSALAHHLAESGKEMEANHLRKEAIHVFTERAGQLETVAFTAAKSLHGAADDESRSALLAEYKDLHGKVVLVSKELEQRKVDLAKLPEGSQERSASESEIKDAEKEAKEKLVPRYNELKQIINGFGIQDKINADLASSSANQAVNMKKAAVSLMVEMGNYDGAFDLVLESVDKYLNSKIGGAESLMSWLVETTIGMAKGTQEGAMNQHKLLELAFEGCLDTATHLDNAVFSGKVEADYLDTALWFRSKAAAISRDLSHSHAETLDPLLSAAKNYGEHGFTDVQANLLEFALKIDMQMSLRPPPEQGIGQYL